MPNRYVITLLVALASVFAQAQVSLGGTWSGTIDIPGNALAIAVTFEEGAQLTGTIDIPAQGALDLPLADVTQNGEDVSFGIEGIPGKPLFEGTLQTEAISGEYSQSGQTFPFELTPGKAAGINRPQEPQAPFAYLEEDVTVKSRNITLTGTLTLPEGNGPFTTLLMLTGSGAQDRNSTLMGHKPFLVLADALARAGYASLRLDDRGVGGSSGNLSQATFVDLTNDAVAAVDFLEARPDVKSVGLLGHSEGGYIAPLAANKSADVAFVILLAGPAVDGESVLLEQNRRLFRQAGAADQADEQIRYLRQLITLLREENYDKAEALVRNQVETQVAALPANQRPDAATVKQMADAQVTNVVSPNFRSFVTYDPTRALEAMRLPILALYGGKDIQVAADQSAPVLQKLLTDDTAVTIQTFPNLNHLLQPAKTGSVEEYALIETTVAPVVLEQLTNWLEKHF